MATKYKLLSQLRKSLELLKHRRDMIPKYVDQLKHWHGPNHYSMDMIPEIEFQIEEMEAAIHGIEMLKQKKRREKAMKTFDELFEEYKVLHRRIKQVPVRSQEFDDLWKQIKSKRKEAMNHPDHKKWKQELLFRFARSRT